MKTQVYIHGIRGRMGQELVKLVSESKELILNDAKNLNDIVKFKNLVLVDFSSPEGMMLALNWCVRNKVPFVSGTTGLSSKQSSQLKVAAKKIPVMWAPNMSVGISLFIEIINSLGKRLKQFDLQIEEYHHSQKKDAPSGTAKILQEAVENSAQVKMPPILSGRGGGIIGEHKLMIMSGEEVLSIEHTAINRAVFARGALTAVKWIYKKPAGLYTMQDVLANA